MRLFFAILLPEGLREELARTQARLRAGLPRQGIRWVPPEQFHLTLKFLGETSESGEASAVAAAREAAARCAPFDVTISGIGAFPGPHRPEVIWAGAQKSLPDLAGLAQYLDNGLAERGFTRETRRFNAHLTFARIKLAAAATAVGAVFPTRCSEINQVDKFGAFVVESFVLMRSELCPSGPVYSVRETFPLSLAQEQNTG